MTHALGTCLAVATLFAGCGGQPREDALPTPDVSFATPPAAETDKAPAASRSAQAEPDEIAKLERTKELASRSVKETAKAGDQSALRAAERRLDRAARKARRARRDVAVAPADPITRLLATFPYKEAPLFVQQTTRAEGDNVRLFASVLQDQFCLKSRRQRVAAVQGLVRHIDKSLRGRGSEELELIVVPLTATAPVAGDAFAVAREGTAKLTTKGRRC